MEKKFECPICGEAYGTVAELSKCVATHAVIEEKLEKERLAEEKEKSFEEIAKTNKKLNEMIEAYNKKYNENVMLTNVVRFGKHIKGDAIDKFSNKELLSELEEYCKQIFNL